MSDFDSGHRRSTTEERTQKRGRKQDDSLPPSRSRDVQRAFRARKAEYVSTLEARIKRLEMENTELRERLGEGPRSITPSSSVPPGHSPIQDIADQVINSVRAATTVYPTDQDDIAIYNWSPPSPDLSLTRTLPLRSDSPTREMEQTFVRACCATTTIDALVDSHYFNFCKTLMRGLELTGKGISGRTSYSTAELRELSARSKDQCCEGIVDCTQAFEDASGEIPRLPEGYINVTQAWEMLRYIGESAREETTPIKLAEMILDSGQEMVPGSKLLKYVSTNIRCERHHGLLIIEGIVEGVLAVVSRGTWSQR